MISGIYKILNKQTSDYYIGSSKNIHKRWTTHKHDLNKNNHHNSFLQRAWNKYGSENFIFEIIEECNIELLLEKEQIYLNNNPKYNIGLIASGGDNLTNHPNRDNIIKKISESIRIRYSNMSNEEKMILSERLKCEKNPNFGNKWTEKMKNDASLRSKEYSKTHKNYKSGKTHKEFFGEEKSKEISEKMSKKASNRIGIKNGFFGKNHSDKTKNIMSENKIEKYFGEQNLPFIINNIEYKSLGEASKKLSIPTTTIRWRIKSKNEKFINYYYKLSN